MRILALLLLLTFAVPAAEGDQAQPYKKIRYPTFKNGRLQSLLEADQAEAYDVAEGTPRVNLKNVVITIYDDSEESLAKTPEDQPLPVKMLITSDRGHFVRRPPEPDSPSEEIANLEGNVIMKQMRLKPLPPLDPNKKLRLDPSVETVIECQHAQWNNTLRKLNGDGEVRFYQEDSTIVGTGFLYLADDAALETSSSTSNVKEWGGIVYIEHNARMEINRYSGTGASGLTEITCRDTASYKLREREIQFEREVRVNRPGLRIESDILKVFLRHEDDPLPTNHCGDATAGQVKSIVATIGKRPGSVIITGYDKDTPGVILYTARGGRADFDYDTNRITLTDSRIERVPEVMFGQDRISDRVLDFIFETNDADCSGTGGKAKIENTTAVLDVLNASGGQGQVLLKARPLDDGPSKPIDINYKGRMAYSRRDGRIQFTDSVFLKRDDLRIRAENVDVHLVMSPGSDIPDQLQRVLAENDVTINTGGREAKAHRAEYDLVTGTTPDGSEQTLDVLRLFGPAQGMPPHPWVRDDEGHQITAPIIHMQRLKTGPGEKPRHLVHGSGGVAICEFNTDPDNLSDEKRRISIKCDDGMEYNEAKGLAWFKGNVMATSDAPEDNYVMTSDKLDIYMIEEPVVGKQGETYVRLRRIDASGNARMMQDTRVCEANQIIRDFPSADANEGDIYLEGTPPRNGQPARMAVYREQIGGAVGSMFAAPRIMASARGDLIRANGPGELSTPDPDMPGFRSEIKFDGAARYESFHDGLASEAKFRKNVVLRQPSRGLVISAEEVDTRFLKDGAVPDREQDRRQVEVEQLGHLRRAEARINVRIENRVIKNNVDVGKRQAMGDRCVVDFTNTGNVLNLTADRRQDSRRFVLVQSHDGLTLRSPHVEVRELQGITRAAGPGELQMPGNRSGEGMSKVPTRVLFGEKGMMVYNELAMNIKISDNVHIIQPGVGDNWSFPSLDGRCDRLDITLIEPPTENMAGEEALSRVLRMDAMGGVLLRVYAEPPPDSPNIDWLSRPGTTFFTRGDQAVYDVPEGRIVISSIPPRQPQLLLNTVDAGRAPHRQRLKADRFVLNTNTVPRRWYFEGQLESNTLRSGEQFEFQD